MNRMCDLRKMQDKMRHRSRTDGLRLLFIGNSATYVHDLPQTLCRLAADAGYYIEAKSIVKGGYELSQHADVNTPHGHAVLDEIAQGYDVVFLQDNGSCVTSIEKSSATRLACDTLHHAIASSGSQTYIYVRPPYGYDHAGRTPLEQCIAFDALFVEIAARIGAGTAFLNRAFAYAMTHLEYDLWGPDHAHTSEYGAYLAACVFFATLFGISSTVLGTNGLSQNDALALQTVADQIAINSVIPWDEQKKKE